MNVNPPPQVIKAPDFSKGLADLRSGLAGDGKIDPAAATLDGLIAGNFILNFVKVALFWFARGTVLPYELLLRRRIGERYVTAPVVAACVGVLSLFSFSRPTDSFTPFTIGLIVSAGYLVHDSLRTKAQRKGIHWHSYSEGASWLDFPTLQARWNAHHGPLTTVNVAKNFLEPLVPLVLASVFMPVWLFERWSNYGPTVLLETARFNYFLTAAITMAVYQRYCAQIARGHLLDHLDNQLMMVAHEESVKADEEPRPKDYRGTASMPVMVSQVWKPNKHNNLNAAVPEWLRKH